MTKEEIKERDRKYYLKNKEEIKQKTNEWKKNNRQKINDSRKLKRLKNKKERIVLSLNDKKVKAKKYRDDNKEQLKTKRKLYYKNRIANDFLFKIKNNIRCSIRKSLKEKGFRKPCKTIIILGCSFEEFKSHLESKFECWMNWSNYGKYNGEKDFGWDIDHIIPTSSVNIEEELIKLNHYTNLQPLCSYINRNVKRDNI